MEETNRLGPIDKRPRIVFQEYQSIFNRKKKEDEDEDYFDAMAYENKLDENESNLDLLDDGELTSEPFVIGYDGSIIPIKEYHPIKGVYNFYTATTNFDITDGIIKLLDDIEGIETLEWHTRYRMRIGIGKLFKPYDVCTAINNAVHKYIKSNLEQNGQQTARETE